MGMSASQARLLTLTARIHDVENEAQRIQNQKLLLANESDEAYKQYLDAIEKKDIQNQVFDAETGECDFIDSNFASLIDAGYAFRAKENATGEFIDCYSYGDIKEALGITGEVADTKELLSDLISNAAVMICKPDEVNRANTIGVFQYTTGAESIAQTGSLETTGSQNSTFISNTLADYTATTYRVGNGVSTNPIPTVQYKISDEVTLDAAYYNSHMSGATELENARIYALNQSFATVFGISDEIQIDWYDQAGAMVTPDNWINANTDEHGKKFNDYNLFINGCDDFANYGEEGYNLIFQYDFIPTNYWGGDSDVGSISGSYYIVTNLTEGQENDRILKTSKIENGEVLDEIVVAGEIIIPQNPVSGIEDIPILLDDGQLNDQYAGNYNFNTDPIYIDYKNSDGTTGRQMFQLKNSQTLNEVLEEIENMFNGKLIGEIDSESTTADIRIHWTAYDIELLNATTDGDNDLADALFNKDRTQEGITEGYYYEFSPLTDNLCFDGTGYPTTENGDFQIRVGEDNTFSCTIGNSTKLNSIISSINATDFLHAEIIETGDTAKLSLTTTITGGSDNEIKLGGSSGLLHALKHNSSSTTGSIGGLLLENGTLKGNLGLNPDEAITNGNFQIKFGENIETFNIYNSLTLDGLLENINESDLDINARIEDNKLIFESNEFSENKIEFIEVEGGSNFVDLLTETNGYSSVAGKIYCNGCRVNDNTIICNNLSDFNTTINTGSFTISIGDNTQTFELDETTTVGQLCTDIQTKFQNEVVASFENGKFVIRAANGRTPLIFKDLEGSNFCQQTGYGEPPELEDTTVTVELKLREVSDDTELAKAEADYEASLKRIDRKDNKYDKDLKKIDNKRSALTTEIDTLKTCISENVDRTFKLFS